MYFNCLILFYCQYGQIHRSGQHAWKIDLILEKKPLLALLTRGPVYQQRVTHKKLAFKKLWKGSGQRFECFCYISYINVQENGKKRHFCQNDQYIHPKSVPKQFQSTSRVRLRPPIHVSLVFGFSAHPPGGHRGHFRGSFLPKMTLFVYFGVLNQSKSTFQHLCPAFEVRKCSFWTIQYVF